jgi:hypothetical protein
MTASNHDAFTGKTLPAESVALPTNGVIYPHGSFFHAKKQIEYKPMTPYHEDILMNPAYRKSDISIGKLISECVGSTESEILNLLVGDKNALMIAIFISNYGKNCELKIVCPHCEEQAQVNIDLTTLSIKPSV